MRPKLFPPEVHDFFKANNHGRTAAEMTELLNSTFGTGYTVEQIKNYRSRQHWDSGLTGRFEKGNVPFNKGLKGVSYPGMEATQFKKGHPPHNHRPVGSTRVDCDGYIWQKVEEPNKWRPLHVLNWEAVHGPVPKGHIVVFKDRNQSNCEVENLLLITKAEHAIMCKRGLYTTMPEATEAGQLIARLALAKSKAKKQTRKSRKKVTV